MGFYYIQVCLLYLPCRLISAHVTFCIFEVDEHTQRLFFIFSLCISGTYLFSLSTLLSIYNHENKSVHSTLYIYRKQFDKPKTREKITQKITNCSSSKVIESLTEKMVLFDAYKILTQLIPCIATTNSYFIDWTLYWNFTYRIDKFL